MEQLGDWFSVELLEHYLPALHNFLAGRSPYEDPAFFGPPWSVLPVIPIAWIPEPWVAFAWLLFNIGVCLCALSRLRVRPRLSMLLLLSPLALGGFIYGQLTSFIFLGAVLSTTTNFLWLAFVLLSFKPHLGGLFALFAAVRLVQEHRWKLLVKHISLAALVCSPLVVLRPQNLLDFLARTAEGRAAMISPEYLSNSYDFMQHVLSPQMALLAYVGLVLLCLTALRWRHDLPMIAAVTLACTPYARNYDFALLLLPLAALLHSERPLASAGVFLALLPFYRAIPLSLGLGPWTDAILPWGFSILLLLDQRTGKEGKDAEYGTTN